MPRTGVTEEPKTIIGYFIEAQRMRRQRIAIEKIMNGEDDDLRELLRMIVHIEMRPPGMTSQELIRQLERALRPTLIDTDTFALGKRRRKLLQKAGYEVVSCGEDDRAIATIGVTINGTTIFAPQPQ